MIRLVLALLLFASPTFAQHGAKVMSALDILALQIPAGKIKGISSVNKFGRAPSGVQTSNTDIWDRADATPTQSVWTAPTQARVHNIVSTSAADSTGSTGAFTLQLYGLTSWDTKEVSETITLDGVTGPNTSNAYVIIHRMLVLTAGSSGTNAGTITATAATDGTVTAQINAGEGQTQMAIYGVPSVQDLYVTGYYGSVNKAQAQPAAINFNLMLNPEPNVELAHFIVKHTISAQSDGANHFKHDFFPFTMFSGPCIIKIRGTANTADVEASSGFDLILVDKGVL